MNVFIVYCHPSRQSFTAKVLHSFTEGLKAAGHRYVVSDLYQMDFQSDMTLEEYNREGYYREDLPVPPDVLDEQEKINQCDAIAFIYPVWWSDCPAKLKGWFDRVFTVGYAYGTSHNGWEPLQKALFLCTAGHGLEHLEQTGVAQSMKTVALGDRINNRSKKSEMVILAGQVEHLETQNEENLKLAYEIGKTF